MYDFSFFSQIESAPTSSAESFLGIQIFFARNIPDISFDLGIVTKDSMMANHTSCSISPSQKNSSSTHNLPAPSTHNLPAPRSGDALQSPQREGGTGGASCLNKQIMPIHEGKRVFGEVAEYRLTLVGAGRDSHSCMCHSWSFGFQQD